MEIYIKYFLIKDLAEIFTTYLSQCENKGSWERNKDIFLIGDLCAHNAENSKGFELLTCKFFSFLFLEST